ncbi:MAG: exodeoxyribonuclease V subunit alpha [Flavobacteriales bacterium]
MIEPSMYPVNAISTTTSMPHNAKDNTADKPEAVPWIAILAEQLLAFHPDTDPDTAALLHGWILALGDALARGNTCLQIIDNSLAIQHALAHPLLVSAALADQSPAPLVYDGQRLYFWRQWHEEYAVARQLAKLLAPQPAVAVQLSADDPANPRQRAAIELAARQPFSIITGGPGTGKTFTLVRIVLTLQAAQPELRIALAAPTGKAAQRMQAVLAEEFAQAGVATANMQTAQTVHRLLGLGGAAPKYHAKNLLPFDLVVIDEGSMLDLALASQLFAAVGAGTRLIILGDANQLAAVDAGAVLADLSKVQQLKPYQIELQESRRFDAEQGIGRLAAAVLGNSRAAIGQALRQGGQVQQHLPNLEQPELSYTQLWQGFEAYVAALKRHAEPAELFRCFDQYRILCAQRAGIFGTERVNRAMSLRLQTALDTRNPRQPDWYQGRPVLVKRNDYGLRLSNGDIGLCLRDQHGDWQLHFTHLADPIAVTRLAVEQLDTAFALTIHKSQGSEFLRVAMLLDARAWRLLSRELVYTAITRAKQQIDVWATDQVLSDAVSRPTLRQTGLAEQLAVVLAT